MSHSEFLGDFEALVDEASGGLSVVVAVAAQECASVIVLDVGQPGERPYCFAASESVLKMSSRVVPTLENRCKLAEAVCYRSKICYSVGDHSV